MSCAPLLLYSYTPILLHSYTPVLLYSTYPIHEDWLRGSGAISVLPAASYTLPLLYNKIVNLMTSFNIFGTFEADSSLNSDPVLLSSSHGEVTGVRVPLSAVLVGCGESHDCLGSEGVLRLSFGAAVFFLIMTLTTWGTGALTTPQNPTCWFPLFLASVHAHTSACIESECVGASTHPNEGF